ncbi:Transcription-silencing protein Clr2 [Penicillium cf. griseofulvum]|uniref:Transcription-silencing protein Clr2 n=1 Tax=Penicillium cf. griseofulvum TaxID=2972120 RepID=A0A9W9MSL8_9EURO|nr:Transcription-silencing protein Clr2 [Penicillium cf. griseofulvum]KAJ5446549.1 Transcription-silencing protein Clr2 [Penicillium cf. griseofulvum]
MSSSSEDDDPNVEVIPMENIPSDGDMSTWPGGNYIERSDSRWRQLLAENWLKAMGSYEEGVTHTIEKLPDGYCLFQRPRGTNPSIFDSFLFGHPSGRYYQSQITFLPHFLSLVRNELDKCKCKPCMTMRTRQRRSVPRTSARGISAQGNRRAIQPITNERRPADPEGPDYWRIMVMKLKDKGHLDEDIEQRFNLDWVLTHEWLSDYFMKLVLDPAYVPRRGELVLWIWQGLEDGCLLHNPETGFIEIFGNDNKWHGVPKWRAGVVTQTPEEEGHMVNIIETPDSPRGLSYSGFRVETLPDPLGNDKSYSVQYAYVPLRNIKPFNTWQAYLNGQEREDTHPSIENAMTVMSSWSMVHKFHVIGDWPNARIQCKGIFIGAELLAVHDTVRLRPHGFHPNQLIDGTVGEVTDVMVIEKIQLCLSSCTDKDQEQLAEHFTALISGKVFTTNPNRITESGPFKCTEAAEPIPLTAEETTATFRQVGMSDYGPWYRMANGRTCNVSPHLIIGRCYEPLAAELMFGTHTLGYDVPGVMEGRAYSSQVDTRMAKNKTWFWGDCRVETLGLTEINGVECGRTAAQREEPRKWQAIIKLSHGELSHALRKEAHIPSSGGRPFKSSSSAPRDTSSRPKTGLSQVARNSKLVSSAIGSAPETENDSFDDSTGLTDDQVSGGVSGLGLQGDHFSGEDSGKDYRFA